MYTTNTKTAAYKTSQNMAKLFINVCRKKQRTNAKRGGTKVADRHHCYVSMRYKSYISNVSKSESNFRQHAYI